jgi:hypothetical protein
MYELKNRQIEGVPDSNRTVAVSSIDGGYIGLEDFAQTLLKRGIAAQKARSEHDHCSIGFCAAEEKWYGWSHRAIFGFGVGSKVEQGDLAYVPVDWFDFIACSVRFWKDESRINTHGYRVLDADGHECVHVGWRYSQDVPNEKIRGTIGSAKMYPPAVWGKGEWVAETLEDAKQMAIDFAGGVA